MLRKPLLFTLLSFNLLFLLTSCSGANNEPAFGDETHVVKVMYYDEQQFFRDYGELLYAKYPNIEIEVADMQSIYARANQGQAADYKKAFEDFVEEKNPDLLMLSGDQYKQFSEEGKLLELDSLIDADDYDISTIHPGALEYLKEQGAGKLYGLSPRFYGTALFYNVGLFEKYGVEPPTDQMSWEEVLQLAQRFPADGEGEDRIYGLGTNSYAQYSQLIRQVASTQGLSFVNPEQKQVTVASDIWKRVFETVVNAYKSGAVKPPVDRSNMNMGMEYGDWLLSNPFVAGKSAMMIEGPYLFDQLRQAREQLPDLEPVDYAIVTAPVDPNNREQGGEVQLSSIFAVNAASEATDAAWELVKYLNSEEMARIKSKSTTELLTRTNYVTDRDGRNIEAFYKLKPRTNSFYDGIENLPPSFFGQFDGILNSQLKAAIEDDKPLEEVIQAVQNEGQKALMQAEATTEQEPKTE